VLPIQHFSPAATLHDIVVIFILWRRNLKLSMFKEFIKWWATILQLTHNYCIRVSLVGSNMGT
jgi:hypothetical protein